MSEPTDKSEALPTPAESEAENPSPEGDTPEPAPEAPAETPAEPAAEGSGEGEPAKPKPRPKPRFPKLIRAYRGGRAVEGEVKGVIKGGYEIAVGQARGFCPHSQIEVFREENPESHVGKSYEFRITQLRRGGEDLVLSRRAILEEQRGEEAAAVRATLVEGALTRGRVAGTAAFGAFVDLGAGVMGLVHISELSHQRVRRVEDAVAVGDTVPVKVLKINAETGKISLSVKSAVEDPWKGVAERYAPGSRHTGKVVRLADFGAFVELAPGVEALAPGSEMPPVPGGWKDFLPVGAEQEWQILSVDAKQRRISVALPFEGGVEGELETGSTVKGKVQRHERFGVFVWLAPGRVGLMPKMWTGTPPGTDLSRTFRIGSETEVKVVDISEGGRRIRLAAPGVDTEEEPPPRRGGRDARSREAPPPQEDSGPFGTSLAEKLKAALERGGGDRES